MGNLDGIKAADVFPFDGEGDLVGQFVFRPGPLLPSAFNPNSEMEMAAVPSCDFVAARRTKRC